MVRDDRESEGHETQETMHRQELEDERHAFKVFPQGLTPKLSRIAARSWPHGKLFLPCGRRSDAISA